MPLNPDTLPQSLPRFRLPMLAEGGSYRAFEIAGDAMLPYYPSGTTVVARYVADWSSIADGTPCIVVSQEGIAFRRLHPLPEGFSLGGDNVLCPGTVAKAEDILEIWEAKSHISGYLAPGSMTLEHLASMVADLTQQVKNLKR